MTHPINRHSPRRRSHPSLSLYLFFFNDTATPEIYTLSLHDALPIWRLRVQHPSRLPLRVARPPLRRLAALQRGLCIAQQDRKSTRLNSSHPSISYAVFCLKKKTTTT